MKLSVLAASVSMALLISTSAYAGFRGPSESREVINTVQAAVQASDMTTCVLEGNIVKHLEKNRYQFQDKSGTMIIDIPPHVFGQLDVTPQNTVKITGEVGKKKNAEAKDLHLRVRYIEKIS